MKDNTPLDKMLNIACGCDWITPLFAILRDAAAGKVARFGVYTSGWFTRDDIRKLLGKNGVQSWGYIYNVAGDLIMFSVREESAAQAAEVLERAGVPFMGGAAETAQPAKPVAAFSNDVAMQPMAIVPAPSIWGVLWGFVVRLIG